MCVVSVHIQIWKKVLLWGFSYDVEKKGNQYEFNLAREYLRVDRLGVYRLEYRCQRW